MRTLVLWCPDWPVQAVQELERLPGHLPVAVVDRGQIHACSPTARTEGVRRGLRVRDAQARCPELVVSARDDALSLRMFEPILTCVEELVPAVEVLRPGALAVRIGGYATHVGSETNAGALLAERLVEAGVRECRLGIADGPFAAEQAARRAPAQDCVIVPPGGAADFLAPFPVEAVAGVLGEQTALLRQLGLPTLGDFARLEVADVATRFGSDGLQAHRLARGQDSAGLRSRTPPPELDRWIDLEPPLELIDPIAFTVRQTAERFVGGVAAHALVCTSVRIGVRSEAGEVSERIWLHPRFFDAPALVDRVRWQLAMGFEAARSTALSAPVTQVRFEPVEVGPADAHADGLWGHGPDAKLQQVLSRVQGLLGHESVTAVLASGGRSPADRQVDVAWGDQPVIDRPATQPWPGQLPEPAPATVYPVPRPAVVIGHHGGQVTLSERGVLSGEPTRFALDGAAPQPVAAWAGPWPAQERWWAGETPAARFQVVGVDGSAWLMLLREGCWFAEAAYD